MSRKQNPKSKIEKPKSDAGFTLFELIVTLIVLSILIMGTIPLTQNAAKREKELRLRESLRVMRSAIDEFHRDTVGACRPPDGGSVSDPRSRVIIDDCKIFETENADRYPPTLEVLTEGVKVKPRGLQLQSGRPFDDKNATDLNQNKELNKVYLRELPIDPITGEADWQFRSSYQGKDAGSWDEINVFDVRSSSEAKALNGEKYSDW